ncbi:hypothetical protein WJX72_009975 [[Myrmecia] bisecta]|uniref:Lon N-terminal domain-containing protein n=1 Tax=[Myrmecia] bisecta TaxID=41462 RepID=A0AAW1PPP7_9CHLO
MLASLRSPDSLLCRTGPCSSAGNSLASHIRCLPHNPVLPVRLNSTRTRALSNSRFLYLHNDGAGDLERQGTVTQAKEASRHGVRELPCLPFAAHEVLVPGQTKQLHLYEARYLELLTEALTQPGNLFCHVVVEHPNAINQCPSACRTADFQLVLPCLVQLVKVQRQEVGALVTIRGEGRVRLLELTDEQPYLRAKAEPLADPAPADPACLRQEGARLEALIADVSTLVTKLPRTIDTRAWQAAIRWANATRRPVLTSQSEDPELDRVGRLAWAALHELPYSCAASRHDVLRQRIIAMETGDTYTRVAQAIVLLAAGRANACEM